ncbi:MAG: phosphatidylinositol 4-kinase [Acidobacteria bacterium]|nr:phosphatidylinositol 4-kinase [Acidobacteriota bacterium]MCA1651863.1 phosphatidylinositol 4-kinase [Acidobacteriota bacterium]
MSVRHRLVLVCVSVAWLGANGYLGASSAPRWHRSESQAATASACAKTWIGREAEVEEFIRTAPIVSMKDVPIGVTKPKRGFFPPGGPVASIAWKPLSPGMHRGFWDSYKAEIAAYELDKVLRMQMVPPAVERRHDGRTGAAVQWVENVKGWKISDPVAGPDVDAWNRQVVRMKMFDVLIANDDRNQGNLLYDGEYHLILIDHSRAFTSTKDLVGTMRRIDRDYWSQVDGLTKEQLQPVLSQWIGKKEVDAIIARRDKMRAEIAKMVAARGESDVFIR